MSKKEADKALKDARKAERKSKYQAEREKEIAKAHEEKFFQFSEIMTKKFDSFLDGYDPLFLSGMERNGFKKIPNKEIARRFFDRYISMVWTLRAEMHYKEEEDFLEELIKELGEGNRLIMNSVIQGWKDVDPKNPIYEKFPELVTDTTRRIATARLNKIKGINDKNDLSDDNGDR